MFYAIYMATRPRARACIFHKTLGLMLYLLHTLYMGGGNWAWGDIHLSPRCMTPCTVCILRYLRFEMNIRHDDSAITTAISACTCTNNGRKRYRCIYTSCITHTHAIVSNSRTDKYRSSATCINHIVEFQPHVHLHFP